MTSHYLVVGGVAVNLYGVLRTTADLDLMVHLRDGDNAHGFVAAMKELNYKPRAPVNADDFADPLKRQEWIQDKRALVFTWARARVLMSRWMFSFMIRSFLKHAYRKR